jgi:hypothetical protein
MTALVPDRACGGCTVCCKELTIHTDELKKLPGVLCEHCDEGVGCGIHTSWPALCRTWHCGWRMSPDLDDPWRPDRSGVLITFVEEDGIPRKYSIRPAVRFQLVRPLEPTMWENLVSRVTRLIDDGVPVFLSTSGRPGHTSGRTFLNDGMADAVKAHDHARVSYLLERALLVCVRHVGEPIILIGG